MAGASSHPFLIWPDESTKRLGLIVGIQGVEALVTAQEERQPLLNLRQLLRGKRAHASGKLFRFCRRTAEGRSGDGRMSSCGIRCGI